MARRRHSPGQVIRKLREGEKLLSEGRDLAEVCKHLEISEQSWHRWRNQYGGMKADEAKRLKELERENARLKKLVAEAELDKECSRKSPRENGEPGAKATGCSKPRREVRSLRATSLSGARTATVHAALWAAPA